MLIISTLRVEWLSPSINRVPLLSERCLYGALMPVEWERDGLPPRRERK